MLGKVDWGELQEHPTLIVDGHLSVFVRDVEVELHHIGSSAHTTDDVVALGAIAQGPRLRNR